MDHLDADRAADTLVEVNREISLCLSKARQVERRSVAECARFLSTSRRRYSAIERGDVPITAAELLVLMKYLPMLQETLGWSLSSTTTPTQVRAHLGDTLHFIVQVIGKEK